MKLETIERVTFQISRILYDFVSFTSFHGAKHIADDFQHLNKMSTRSKCSKRSIRFAKCSSVIVWGGSITIGIILTGIMTNLVWERLQNTPTLTTIETYYYPIRKVPFPAVTFCNLNIVYRPAMEKLIDEFKLRFNETALRILFQRLNVVVRLRDFNETTDILELSRAMNYHNYSIGRLMRKVMQPCDRMIVRCAWLNKNIPCDELFQVTRTSKGFCCSFNYRDNSNGSGHTDFFVSGAGEYSGLELILASEPNEYVSYYKTFYGIQIAIHSKEDYPDLSSPVLVQPGYDMKVLIRPSVLTSEENIKVLPVSKRKCIFNNERKLDIISNYTYNSCMIDCRVKNIVELCNCIPYFYPYFHLAKYAHVSECDFTNIFCLGQILTKISSTNPSDVSLDSGHSSRDTIGITCDCEPGCREIRYGFKTTQSNWALSPGQTLKYFGANADVPNQNLSSLKNIFNMSRVFIRFLDDSCVAYKRTVYMTWDSFFASVGGIFGFCLGASIISFIEVIYFFVVRICGRMLSHFFMPIQSQDTRKKRLRKRSNNIEKKVTIVSRVR